MRVLANAENVLRLFRQASPIGFARLNLSIQTRCRLPGPSGFVQKRSGQSDQIRLTLCDDVFGLLRLRDQTHGNGGQSRLRFDASREADLVIGSDRYLLRA